MEVTIGEILQINVLEKAKVLAGRDGLSNVVRHVTVMDAPDIKNWIKGGEFVLTSSYAIKDNEEAQIKLIEDLASRGAIALGIKLGRFIDKLPEKLLELADKLNFPIIEIPVELLWRDIIDPILTLIVDKEAFMLKESKKIEKAFTRLLLDGEPIENFVKMLSKITKNSAMLMDITGKVICIFDWPDNTLTINEDFQEKIINKLNIIEKHENQRFFEEVSINSDSQQIKCLVAPIDLLHEIKAFLIITGIYRSFNDLDIIALEHSRTIISWKLMKQSAIEEVERRYKRNFIEEFLSGKFSTFEEVNSRAKTLGLSLDCNYLLFIVELKPSLRGSQNSMANQEKFLQGLTTNLLQRVEKLEKGIIVVDRGTSLISLVPTNSKDSSQVITQSYLIAKKIKREIINCKIECEWNIGIGRYYSNPLNLPKSYKQAVQAVRLGRKIWGKNNVIHYNDLGIYRFISLCSEQEELIIFYEETIGKLCEYDTKLNAELLQTLEAYYQSNEKVKEVAAKLFIHSNTVKYRLQRIQDITGCDLGNSEQKFNLLVGLRIMQYLENQKK